MKQQGRGSEAATTLFEVLVLVGVSLLVAVAVLTVFLARSKARSSRIGCTNCLKQIGLAFRTFELDKNDLLPRHVSVTNGGAMELLNTGTVFPIFQVMSNELSTPKILVCPDDKGRSFVTTFAKLTDANLSYFANLDALETNASHVLGGDRNLTNQRPASGRFIQVSGTTTLGWSRAIHKERGNILFADGSVNGHANETVRISDTLTNGAINRLAVP